MSTATGWTAAERLLLRAAMGPPADAAAAYAQWRASVDLDALEGGALRVLPLLAERAETSGDDPVMTKIGKVVRFSWLRSQLLLTRTLPGIQALASAGVPVMLAKGAAVVEHTHGQLHLRPMDDLDIVVQRDHAAFAARTLLTAGWSAPSLPPSGESAIYGQVHALDFHDASGAELDLHWQVIHGSLHRGASVEFWQRATPAMLRETPVLTLCPEDTFVQVIGHGERLNVKRPLQWVSDATLLLRDRDDFDWELVASVAARHRLTPVIAGGVEGLRELAPDVVPERLPAELRPRRARRRARSATWHEFVQRSVAPGSRPRAGHVLDFAKETWGVEQARDLPRHALAQALPGVVAPPPDDALPTRAPELPPLLPGTRIGFDAGGEGPALLGAGWWAPDAHGTWSRGREAVVQLPLDVDGPPVAQLTVSFVPFLAPGHAELTVTVLDHGRVVAVWPCRGTAFAEHVRTLWVPGNRPASLRFAVDRRISPTEAELLADHRPMGIALRSITIGAAVPAGG